MEQSTRQVTVIDELWDNEESKTNRRLYDEQDRGLQRQNIELNDRIKKFEKQLEILKNNQLKDHDKELIKRILSKQANEYNKLVKKKDQEIEQLNEQIRQHSKPNLLESALRQSNIERLHLEKRFLSSSSSLNSTTTTNGGPTTTASAGANEESLNSPKSSDSSTCYDDSTHYQAVTKTNEGLKAELDRLTKSNQDNTAKLKLQFEQYDKLQQAYKDLETKYNQLLPIEEPHKKEKLFYDSCLLENKQLKEKLLKIENESHHKDLDEQNKQKQKIDALENELLTLKSTQNHQQDVQIKMDHLQKELELRINEFETISTLNTKLSNELKNSTNTNERLTAECEALRAALVAKADEFDSKKSENEQLKTKNSDLESIIKSLQDTNDVLKRLNTENEINKQELKEKQDHYEQFQKIHDTTKRENQATIHLLQEKIHDLERRAELQSLKREGILLQLDSLKEAQQQHRTLPSSNASSPSISTHRNRLSTIVDSQTSEQDDSAPLHPRQQSTNLNEKLARVVVARYSYEPLRFSPNDHPEIELPLKQGEYYVIYGNIDEDGFYDGRDLEGRYGLVPSNLIELVKNPNDLSESTKHSIQKLMASKRPSDERIPQNREAMFSFDSDAFLMNSSTSIPKTRTSSNSNTSDITNSDLSYGKHIPYPINLHIDKFMNNSVLISWDHPSSSNVQIIGYQVILDQVLYTTIHGNERTRVLIENINFTEKLHRISIRTITQLGLSRDQYCTLLFTNSKDLSYMPSDLRVDRISQTTAVASWWPASNDIIHALFVNDKEVQTFKAGIYRFKLTGLLPNTNNKVSITAKPSIATSPQQHLTISMDFRTTSFDESIEPPRNIQVTTDSQSNTVRVSWEPLSSMSTAHGYRIFIDGHQILDIANPLSDHTGINRNLLHHGRYLTIRTLTGNGGESNDSIPVDLDDVLKKTSRSLTRIASTPPMPSSPSSLIKSTVNGKDVTKSLTRSSLDSPSTVSSTSTDIPQIELSPNSAKTIPQNKLSTKQHDYSDSSRIRTPTNENVNINKSPLSTEQRSIPTTPNKNVRLEPPPERNSHLLDKTNTLPRPFIALFDYDPKAMSPNQNSEEELPFKQGQIIKIYGNRDADGFYIGQTENGHIGYVPSNMVSEVATNDSETESKSTNVSSKKRTPPVSTPTNPESIKKMQAVFEYDANEFSPNADSHDELSFHAGDIIYVHGSVRSDGFYSGELENGKKGLVPSNYLQEMFDEDSSEKMVESIDKQQTPTSVNNETKTEQAIEQASPPTPAPPPPPPPQPPAATSTEATKGSLFDRLKTTFSWNLNEPI
ncbi:unnamed protein product [Rotaria socialis]|uniref:RIMS-binding protein 2 n=1 Tax=Rotaria socialis TaxID=392032 RepID=A0A821BYX8_9BILA|nr:unnamed protein product [Rotaria socialis]CAF4602328.1 unnamed protein product [Rotaria socialis]